MTEAEMFGPGKDQLLFLENFRQVVGEVRELTAVTDPNGWCLAARFGGREVRLTFSGRGYILSSVKFAVQLAVPARLFIEGHYASYSQTPVVRTDDAAFHQDYKVHGAPPEVILAVLDAPTRAWFLRTYGERPPQTATRAGWLSLYQSYRFTRDTFCLPLELVPPPDELRQVLERLLDLADRLAAAYHAMRETIARTQGPDALARWDAEQAGVGTSGLAAQPMLVLAIGAVVSAVMAAFALVALGVFFFG
jgi:hypothetical protein